MGDRLQECIILSLKTAQDTGIVSKRAGGKSLK